MKRNIIKLRLFSSCSNILLSKNSTPEIIRQLDINTSNDNTLPRIKKTKIKLNKSLNTKETPKLTSMQVGTLDAAREEISEILEDCLNSNELLNLFHPFPHTSRVVQIRNVKLNRDISHIDVLWESNFLEEFIQRIYEINGEAEGKRMKLKLYNQVNQILQKKEGKFRTHLMKQIFFRRVPRIFFRAADETVLDPTTQANEMEQWAKEELERQRKFKEWGNENSLNDLEAKKSSESSESSDSDSLSISSSSSSSDDNDDEEELRNEQNNNDDNENKSRRNRELRNSHKFDKFDDKRIK